jgi:hypothetical protein
MDRQTRLILLTASGSAICWWPSFIWPNPNPGPFPFVLVFCLAIIALSAGISTALSGGRWLIFMMVSTIATFLGICAGGIIWPDPDGIGEFFLFYAAGIGAAGAALVSLITGLAVWLVMGPDKRTC